LKYRKVFKSINNYLFIIAKTWKQPRCPSADEWIRKLWYIYTMEYYSAIKKKRRRRKGKRRKGKKKWKKKQEKKKKKRWRKKIEEAK